MTEKCKCFPFKIAFISFLIGIGTAWFCSIYFLQEEEYRKTADLFLGPDGAKLVASLVKEKEIMISVASYGKRHAKSNSQELGRIQYNNFVASHNAAIELIITSFDTGFDTGSRDTLIKLWSESKIDVGLFFDWVKSDTDLNTSHVTVNYMNKMQTEVSISPDAFISKVSEVAVQSRIFRENSRERRVNRMIENLRSCKLPGWEGL